MNAAPQNYAPLDLKNAAASPTPPLLLDVREFPEFARGGSQLIPHGLIFAALTDSCAMEMMLAKMPWNRHPEADDLAKETRPDFRPDSVPGGRNVDRGAQPRALVGACATRSCFKA